MVISPVPRRDGQAKGRLSQIRETQSLKSGKFRVHRVRTESDASWREELKSLEQWTSFIKDVIKAYFVWHLCISAFFVSGRLPEGVEFASENAIPRRFDRNKFPEEDGTLENRCPSQQITSPSIVDKLHDQSNALDTEGIARTLLSLQQFTSHAFRKSTSQDHGGESLAREVISDTCYSDDSNKHKSVASIYRNNPKRSKQEDTAIDEASADSRNQEKNVDNDFSFKPGQKKSSSEGKAQEKELNSSIRQETSRGDKELFKVSDWKFLREYPESAMEDDQMEIFLRYLNKCRGHEESQQFFLDDKEQTIKFMSKFNVGKKFFFAFPPGMSKNERTMELFKTALRISDKRINLEGYPIFSKEIIERMSSQIESNSQKSKEQVSLKKSSIRLQLVNYVTKVTQLLIVIYNSLFKGNENEILTVKQVESTLEFLKNSWLEIEAGNTELIEMDWALNLHKILTYQIDDSSIYLIVSDKLLMYRICWKFLHHWLKKTRNFPIPHMAQEIGDKIIIEVINKMIFFSNHQNFCNRITKVSSKKAISK
ncbi:hypothetical protein VP01_2317g1 [Puccinia sorghi]|uniref:Uncharacterized protein n=1 Tax=Puccinia sorghi TaxID=27349 RepID=A0A0L6V9I8_9BASI|nr:hypothetical protein VP01_2317g1 [Puccinia sorghi]